MKVFITGATGFIGSQLVKTLHEQGNTIKILIFPGEDYSEIADFVEDVVEGDITDSATLDHVADGIDVVYHLAARVVDYGRREDFYDPIVEGTRNLLDLSAEAGVKRFVHVSSICAFGTGKHLKGKTEQDPCKRTGVYYGDAKLDSEVVVRASKDRFEKGFVVARPSNVIGPKSIWVTETGAMMLKGKFVYFDGGCHGAGLVSVHNLVDGLILCGTKDEAALQTYFFCDDWSVTWKTFLDDVARMFGTKIRLSLPFHVAWTLGMVAEKVSPPLGPRPLLTRHAVGLMGRDCGVDTTKARKELGWKSTVTYREAIEEIEGWVRENRHRI